MKSGKWPTGEPFSVQSARCPASIPAPVAVPRNKFSLPQRVSRSLETRAHPPMIQCLWSPYYVPAALGTDNTVASQQSLPSWRLPPEVTRNLWSLFFNTRTLRLRHSSVVCRTSHSQVLRPPFTPDLKKKSCLPCRSTNVQTMGLPVEVAHTERMRSHKCTHV